VGEGDRRAIPYPSFIEEQVDVQGPGAIAIGGPFSAELALDFEGLDEEFIGI
jgi:hypothetical protein